MNEAATDAVQPLKVDGVVVGEVTEDDAGNVVIGVPTAKIEASSPVPGETEENG